MTGTRQQDPEDLEAGRVCNMMVDVHGSVSICTNISSLDHAHIVPTVSDTADTLLGEAAD